MNAATAPDQSRSSEAPPQAQQAEIVEQAFQLVLGQQGDPSTACAYLGTTADGLRAELDDLDVPWPESLRVGVEDDRVVAAVLVEHDEETGRSWVHGPWTADDAAWSRWADVLLDAALAQTPDGVDDHELCAAPANRRVAALAASRGWPAGDVNIVYVARSGDGWPASHEAVRSAIPEDLAELTRLHDDAFPGTYATARQLLTDPDRTTLVLDRDEAVLGYASAEVQPDGAGYLDFVAIAATSRGRGLGRALVADIARQVLARPGVDAVRLTVEGSNTPAVALYESLGFVREAELVGYRSARGLDQLDQHAAGVLGVDEVDA
ncbi:GNAT family N-acetyltransferase [Ornithinimicrobium sufpigmenti]|uniref:GNAT family N-acetyltransferase n=1 Tax=Ornithinimicrobium sufpigmenti TaxID=2508882 RepID=UPI0015E1B6F5|nr:MULTISPECIES: N-acetyltransferase [unclassified Ornithinimicrobium]